MKKAQSHTPKSPEVRTAGTKLGAPPLRQDAPATAARTQAEEFDKAMRLFHQRDFASALLHFEKCAAGENRDMAYTAKQHIRMCQQRIAQSQPDLRTPEDLYYYAVNLISQRRPADAEQILKRALEQSPKSDHIQYALCLSRGLQGDLEGAARHLETAIRLDPRNRTIARTDPDFLEFGRQSPVREIVFGDKKL
ncbi:MAG: tetratricopeptide repeat protein [Bryobacterales bacterium]|nr:tetratricopeptide repeat protein [Bryobacterales bacterium]